jgi:hypothetical protein
MRARGANALLRALFETTYGTPPGGNSSAAVRQLGPRARAGADRERSARPGPRGLDPTLDVVNNDGNLVVPVDARAFGYWLKLYFGAPTTAAFGRRRRIDRLLGAAGGRLDDHHQRHRVHLRRLGRERQPDQHRRDAERHARRRHRAQRQRRRRRRARDLFEDRRPTLTVAHDAAGTAGNAFTLSPERRRQQRHRLRRDAERRHQQPRLLLGRATALPSMSIEVANPEVPASR